MALWKDTGSSKPTPAPAPTPDPIATARFDAPVAPEPKLDPTASASTSTRPVAREAKSESLIAPDIAIEGKIEGSGHVRIAGRFKGDIDVRGDLTIEPGAKVNGSVRADKVLIAGELIGNIDAASHVELLKSGALTGDLKAASLTVAAGSRMRGQAEFGWDDSKPAEGKKNGADRGAAS